MKWYRSAASLSASASGHSKFKFERENSISKYMHVIAYT